MFISKVELLNFKRFTNLTIDLSGEVKPPKLVLLIGKNGIGKSSIFDAFHLVSWSRSTPEGFQQNSQYYLKRKLEIFLNGLDDPNGGVDFHVKIELENGKIASASKNERKGFGVHTFYGRTSKREVSRLTRNRVTAKYQVDLVGDEDKSEFFIDNDNRFENDLDLLMSVILSDVFIEGEKTSKQVIAEFIEPLNNAFRRIFGANEKQSLILKSYTPPLSDRPIDVIFTKDDTDVNYNYLSSGEKAIFNILLNLFVRNTAYTNTIYYLDELDLHLNTKLQKALLREIVENWIPENCQLWTASHSLGFIEYANETEHSVIIDFDNLDFDQKQILAPKEKQQFDVFEIAVPAESLAELLKDKKVVFAENTDTEFYNRLKIVNTVFVNAVDRNDVFTRATTTPNFGLADRDYLTDGEVVEIHQRYSRFRLLGYYSIENYFYHPDNIQELLTSMEKTFDRQSYIDEITNCKNSMLGDIAMGLHRARGGYFYFKEDDKRRSLFQKNEEAVLEMLKSNDFEIFYKVFPMKGNCATLAYKNQLSTTKLARTNWFVKAINERLKA